MENTKENKNKIQEKAECLMKVRNVSKTFIVGKQQVPVLHDISFEVLRGDYLILFGPSGSGKSTLLHAILGLEKPTSGSVDMLDYDIYQLNEDERSEMRKRYIGMVYQQPNWIRSLSVIDNVAFPLILRGVNRRFALKQADVKLKIFGMSDWSNYRPTELSSGQQQRVSLARALVTDPDIIVADEPTGNLDNQSGQQLVAELLRLSEVGHTVIMVSHELGNLNLAKTAIHIVNGRVIDKYERTNEAGNILQQVVKKGAALAF